MEIRDKHIREAEALLINGHEFDSKERVPFIKNLQSCDLLAVPGSGKTTALQAKLYCLSKHLPFDDGSGVLILSHTNAAIDEIEKNLKPHCPKLFEYPNFVGTVQSFINKFLMTPYYTQKNGNTQIHIDGELYRKMIDGNLDVQYSSPIVYLRNNNKKIFFNARFWFDENKNVIISDGISQAKLKIKPPNSWIVDNIADNNISEIERYIISTKTNLIKKGILHYDDCYFLAQRYIQKYPIITDILKLRFKFVFIDEMQDLEEYQISIIDKIFHSNNSSTQIQRIGDINQAIYNSGRKVKVQADWIPRNQMYLNGSNRLTIENAAIVNSFTLDRQQDEDQNPRFVVTGQRPSFEPCIKPHLILFDELTKGNLIGRFERLIKQYHLEETKEAEKYGFKIIGWNAKWEDYEETKGRLRLEDIFKGYKKEISSNKENFDCLSKYIQCFDQSKSSLSVARNSILNALIAVLSLEGKKAIVTIRGTKSERDYTKTTLLRYIQDDTNNCDHQLFKEKIYRWSFDLAAKQDFTSVYDDIKAFILRDFKNWFGLNITQEVSAFIGKQFETFAQYDKEEEDVTLHEETIKIDIGTVHSAKGKTHCATMYVETAYQRPPYETKKIIKRNSNPLLLQENECNGAYDRQALKMMYVGFSRPTHLLCFAVLKENIEASINEYQNNGWEVVDLTESVSRLD